jgi:hypothetical protein
LAKGHCIPINIFLQLLDLNTLKFEVTRQPFYVNENEQLIIVIGTRAHHYHQAGIISRVCEISKPPVSFIMTVSPQGIRAPDYLTDINQILCGKPN